MDEKTLWTQYEALEDKVKSYNPSLNTERLKNAFIFAAEAHGKQFRKDGSAFVTHPLAAAEITADMGLDEDSLIAALLHDCIEDTGVTYEMISKQFGASVAALVDGVTKLTRVVYTTKEEEQMENLRKMLMAMARDIRVILIKIADRLHNMRTMNYQSGNKQREKALETMEIYAPIAHRLGMQKIKWELEDLSLKYLDPIGYDEITGFLLSHSETHGEFLQNIKDMISTRLESSGIKAVVQGRTKHIYSIYRKMYGQNKMFSEVFDLYAFRVIVDSIYDCYNVLGQIHDLFKPVPDRFKDYIGTPKPNMYQSLHTTVIGSHGIPFEVQIRTMEMHQTAEYGIAAHWKYKGGIADVKTGDEEKFAWIRRLLEAQQDSDAQDFFHDLKIDMFSDEVFVFTPRGDVINLPAGATPIDFAYSIHSAVGNHMTGAMVNGRIVPFDAVLQNGDVIEIITSQSSKGPSRDWIKIAKSSEARNKIKQWFKRERREENIIQGRQSFESEMRRNSLSVEALSRDEALPQLLKKISFSSLDELYAAIGYGGITATRAVNRIRDELLRLSRSSLDQNTVLERLNHAPSKKASAPTHGVVVEGLDNCLIKFSRCCTPVPGDLIRGFITRGYGVSVHRADCPNHLNSIENSEEADRWIGVTWSVMGNEYYQTALTITAEDRGGFIMDVAMILNGLKIKVSSMSVKSLGGGLTLASLVLEVHNLEQLHEATAKLRSVRGVKELKRTSA